MTTRITKTKTDRVIDGVCGGLGEYFGIYSVIIRFLFVALTFFHGMGIILYIILAIIMPKAENIDKLPKETIRENVQEMSERVKQAGEEMGTVFSKNIEEKHTNYTGWFGLLLILLGVFFLLENLNLIRWFNNDLLWPIIIIFIGAWLLIKRWS